ncbi:MAG: DUF2298 domain-containing protein [Patescibacteria group bacterium]
MLHDLALIFYCWFLSSLWLFISLPFVSTYTKTILKDAGWAMNRAIGWLLIGLPVWYLAHFGMPINSKPGIWGVFLILIIASAYFWKKTKFDFPRFFKEYKSLIIAEELLFLFGIFFLSIIRGFSPDINSLEKFMDGGLIVSYVKSPTLPIEDMWLAGSTFNYYTFGHFQGAVATQFWSIDPALSYNILLGLLMALSLQLSFSVVINLMSQIVQPTEPLFRKIPLLKKFASKSLHPKNSLVPLIVIGVIGAYLVNFAGNTQPLWYLLARCYSHYTSTAVNFSPADENAKPIIAEACSYGGYWYPNATRFIPRTIHEFPSYSFIVSDLHAHVWNLVNVLTFFLIVFVWGSTLLELAQAETAMRKKSWLTLTSIIGVFMGIFVMTSTWDGLVYSLFLCVISSILLLAKPQLFLKLVASGIMIIILMVITSSPWWLHFDSISQGAAIATEHTIWWQLVVLWFAHIFVGCVGAALTFSIIKKNKQFSFAHLMLIGFVVTAICLIILPELFYIRDIYSTQPRANTMFKLTYQAFIQLSIVMAITLGILLSKLTKGKTKSIHAVTFMSVVMLVVAVGIYPYFGYRDYYLGTGFIKYDNFSQYTHDYFKTLGSKYHGLDGMRWLDQQYPDDYQAYLWLKKVDGRPHIVEAVGDSYTTFDRMSAFTGLPTVLGWRVHEWLWRGSYDIPGKRSAEVESMYLSPLSDESQRLFNQYLVKYVIVGDKEREAYPQLNPSDLKKLGKVVFEEGQTFIIER